MNVPPDKAVSDALTVRRSARMLEVRIARPEKRNALSRKTIAAIGAAFADHAADERLLAAVVTGAGDKSFAAGGDLKDLDSVRTRAAAIEMSVDARRAFDAIRRFPVPVVAALNGDALGGGAELAAACDFRVAAPHARIGFVQGKLAITTAWGGAADLCAIVGFQRALRLTAGAEILTAHAARDIGLVDLVADPGESLAEAVSRFLVPMLSMPRVALAGAKKINRAARTATDRDAVLAVERDTFCDAWIGDEHWAAVDAFYSRKKA